MAEYKLGEIETIFADIIWDNEPITSRRPGPWLWKRCRG